MTGCRNPQLTLTTRSCRWVLRKAVVQRGVEAPARLFAQVASNAGLEHNANADKYMGLPLAFYRVAARKGMRYSQGALDFDVFRRRKH